MGGAGRGGGGDPGEPPARAGHPGLPQPLTSGRALNTYLLLPHPSANRVYAAAAAGLLAAELACTVPEATSVEVTSVAGLDYVAFSAGSAAGTGRLGGALALFRRTGADTLVPEPLERPDTFDDDLVTIPKYAGKTNEQLTRTLVNLTVSAATPTGRPFTVLDPLCGRGTTLSTAWTFGHDAAGVEVEQQAITAYGAFLRTYLRRKRIKHTVDETPLRREGRSLGKRLDASVTPPRGDRSLTLAVLPGDTRDAGSLWGKRRFDAIVADAPYGVQHGSRDTRNKDKGARTRSAASLLAEALPVWAGLLRGGGALGIAWNTLNLDRAALSRLVGEAGLEVRDDGAWTGFAHRVDASIARDLLVAVKPS